MKSLLAALSAAAMLAAVPAFAADDNAGKDTGMNPQSTQKPIPGAAGKSTNSDGSSVSSGPNGSSTGPGGGRSSSGPNPAAVDGDSSTKTK
jgi:hypothetical protein